MIKKKAIIVSGYFNPIHVGHLDYFNRAKDLADYLFVIVNSDLQRKLKGSKKFQNQHERLLIVSNIKAVDNALISIDKDRTVSQTLKKIFTDYADKYDLVFANGGDQNNDCVPERSVCESLGISMVDGLGDKIQSSSWLLKN